MWVMFGEPRREMEALRKNMVEVIDIVKKYIGSKACDKYLKRPTLATRNF